MPSRVSGTIRKLTSGTATRLDSAPTSDVSPKNHKVSGSSATAITACASVTSRTRPRQPSSRATRLYIRNATPANDSQKPALNTDSGSTASIANKASASDCAGDTWRREQRASATTAIISKVRTVGRPNPASAL
ncbi:hypothetical protein FHW85_001047 [Dyella sp. SG609]|nr:hypothetical protein [Dyella sp. SG609]